MQFATSDRAFIADLTDPTAPNKQACAIIEAIVTMNFDNGVTRKFSVRSDRFNMTPPNTTRIVKN